MKINNLLPTLPTASSMFVACTCVFITLNWERAYTVPKEGERKAVYYDLKYPG